MARAGIENRGANSDATGDDAFARVLAPQRAVGSKRARDHDGGDGGDDDNDDDNGGVVRQHVEALVRRGASFAQIATRVDALREPPSDVGASAASDRRETETH